MAERFSKVDKSRTQVNRKETPVNRHSAFPEKIFSYAWQPADCSEARAQVAVNSCGCAPSIVKDTVSEDSSDAALVTTW